jgi:tartrate-resistant acid phosphatase type 5
MSFIRPTRRDLIVSAPLLVGAAALPMPLLAQIMSKPLNFLVIGDWGRDGKDFQTDVARRMIKTAAARESRFVASTGDNFYTLGVSSKDDRQWETSFEHIYPEGELPQPWYAVLGNHDYGGNVHAQLERDGTGRWNMPELWYPVIAPSGRSDVDLFFINTVVWLGKESFPFKWLGSDIEKGDQQRQIDWLVGALARSTARFKLVFGHHGIYSIGPHGGKMLMKELDEVLREYGVTAYISGHDHCLYHISRDGMHYICSGGGSQLLATYTGGGRSGCVFEPFCDPAAGDAVFPYWHWFMPEAGFASIDVWEDRIDLELIGVGGGPYGAYRTTLFPPPRQGRVAV